MDRPLIRATRKVRALVQEINNYWWHWHPDSHCLCMYVLLRELYLKLRLALVICLGVLGGVRQAATGS